MESTVSKEKYIAGLLNALKPADARETRTVDSLDNHFPLSMLKEHASKGSSTAANLAKAKEHWLRAVSYFEAPNISNKYHRDAINQLFLCLTVPNGEILCAFTKELYFNFRKAADRLFAENPLDGSIFYVLTYLRALKEGLPRHINGVKEFLKKSIDHEAELTKLLGIMYQIRATHGSIADAKLCVKCLTKAIELYGDKVSIHIYFLRASSARMVDKTVKLAIKDYRYYLANASIDARSYPEACYGLAYTLGHKRYKYNESREIYDKGIEAELHRLPFFGPIKDNVKNLMAMDPWIIKPINKLKSTGTPAQDKEVKFTKGAKVKLQGLKVKEFNGKVGTVVGCRVDVAGVFRYPVELEAGCRPKRLRPENLELLK